MKVYNMTDMITPSLQQYNMLNQDLAVGPYLIEAGTSKDIPDEEMEKLLPTLQHLVMIGALAVGQPPAAYAVNRVQEAASSSPPPTSKRGR